MTTYAPPSVVACPKCESAQRIERLASGNTIGASLWSDGFLDAPMLPATPPVQRCPTCSAVYWPEDARELDDDDVIRRARAAEAEEASPHQILTAIEGGLARSQDEERLLRQWVAWLHNHGLRKARALTATTALAGPARENLEVLAKLLAGTTGEDAVMHAEILRELGRFDECLAVLATVTDDALRWAVTEIGAQATAGGTGVFLLQGDE